MDTRATEVGHYRKDVPGGKNPEPGPLSLAVAAHIRRLLTERGMSQAALAREIGMSPSQLSKCLRGDRVFDLEQLGAVAETFDTTVEAIIHAASRGHAGDAATP